MRRLYLACALISWISLIYTPFVSPLPPLAGIILILLFVRRTWPDSWRERAGLNINLQTGVLAIGITAILIWIFKQYFLYSSSRAGVEVALPSILNGFKAGLVFTLIQTLAEEIILGSLLLRYTRERFPAAEDYRIAVGVGLLFALLHALFYQVGLFHARASLSVLAILGIFLAGTLRNLLILTHGHIAFAWALHFSWNVHMFNSDMQSPDSYLSEVDRFNLLLGSWEFIGLSLLAVGVISCRRIAQ